MPLPLLLGLVFISATLILILLAKALQGKQDPLIQRIQDFTPDTQRNVEVIEKTEAIKIAEQLKTSVNRVLAQLGELSGRKEEKQSRLRQMLIYAGIRQEDKINRFIGFKHIAAMIAFAVCMVLGFLGQRTFPVVLLLSIVIGIVGYQFPDLYLKQRIRARQAKIAEGLPDALDLLVICVEAGLGLNAAILRVGNDIRDRCFPLSDELLRVNHDLRGGISREEALRSLSDRNLVEDLKILVGAMILSDRLGTSIADTLRSQADSLRTRIRQKAEEQAAKAGIKMLLPLVLFILPALIIILMGPGLIAVFRTFK